MTDEEAGRVRDFVGYGRNPPDPKWPADRTEEWMKGFNNSMIPGTTIHEVYPGHFVQFLWINQSKSKIRKLIACGSNAEGCGGAWRWSNSRFECQPGWPNTKWFRFSNSL